LAGRFRSSAGFPHATGQNSHIEQYQLHQTQRGARIGIIATGPIEAGVLKRELVSALAEAGLVYGSSKSKLSTRWSGTSGPASYDISFR
jgi:hypothetical protein